MKLTKQSGISKMELLVGLVLCLAIGLYFKNSAEYFSVNSKKSEAKLMLTVVEKLYKSYKESKPNSDILDENFERRQRAFSGWFYFLSDDDYTSETSCVLDNPLGFRLSNCKKMHYQYHLVITEGGNEAPCTQSLCLAALEGGYFSSQKTKSNFTNNRKVYSGCKDRFADFIAKDFEKQKWVLNTPSC